MKNVLKGSIFYVIIAIIVVLGINYIRGNLVENTGVTYSQFQKYVAQNKVSGVEVRQNSQGVTGELTVHLKDGEYRTLDVSDVTKAEDLLEQKNISYKVTVEKESVFMTTVLPMLLIQGSDFIKREVVEIDPTEQNERATLNFGHTLGHAIEKLKNFTMLHGHCVAVGALAAMNICKERGLVKQDEIDAYKALMEYFFIPTSVSGLNTEEVIAATKNDKKMEAGVIKFILLDRVGHAYIDRTVTKDEMERALATIFR